MAAPTIGASSRKGAEGTVLVSALVVGAVYAYRKLIEPSAATLSSSTTDAALRQVIGLEAKPAPVAQFTIAYGFTFFTLSIVAMAAPEAGAAFAILIAVGDVLANGASVFTDISRQVAGATAVAPPASAPAGHAGEQIVGTTVTRNKAGGPVETPIYAPKG